MNDMVKRMSEASRGKRSRSVLKAQAAAQNGHRKNQSIDLTSNAKYHPDITTSLSSYLSSMTNINLRSRKKLKKATSRQQAKSLSTPIS